MSKASRKPGGKPKTVSSPDTPNFTEVFAKAKKQLALSFPTAPLCRDTERAEIINWLQSKSEPGERSKVLYISGMVGSGKTLVVHECTKNWRGRLVSINAVRDLKDASGFPRLLWKRISELDGLTEPPLPSAKAFEKLNEYFKSSKSKPLLLFVDEVDHLHKQNMKVLYSLFDWPLQSHCLRVIAISNDISLIDRLHNKLQSRAGHHRVQFAPYPHEALKAILTQRLDHCEDLFDPKALEYISKRVGTYSGDARRALQVCSTLVNEADLKYRTTGQFQAISSADASKVAEATVGTFNIRVLKSLAPLQFLFLAAVVYLQSNGGVQQAVKVLAATTLFFEWAPRVLPELGIGPEAEHTVLTEENVMFFLTDLQTTSLLHVDSSGRHLLSQHSTVRFAGDAEDVRVVANNYKEMVGKLDLSWIFNSPTGAT
jgi:Cdc6-like AAA superfamily ATPase